MPVVPHAIVAVPLVHNLVFAAIYLNYARMDGCPGNVKMSVLSGLYLVFGVNCGSFQGL